METSLFETTCGTCQNMTYNKNAPPIKTQVYMTEKVCADSIPISND